MRSDDPLAWGLIDRWAPRIFVVTMGVCALSLMVSGTIFLHALIWRSM
jgi:hypothetical protein